MANLLQSGVASAERVFALLDADGAGAGPGRAWRGRRRYAARSRSSDVSFRYKPDEPLIEDLSLSVEPGQTVAIVGPTGAGKTTLVNLLMRFYEVDGGRITLDGVDIADMTPRATCASQTGMVLQDTWLFGGTIARQHRLRRGRREPRRRSSTAAQATHVDRFVHDPARRLRHGHRRRGLQRQRGGEAADHDRPRVPGRARDPDPGRGDQLGRHPDRGADPAGDERAARRAAPASSSRTGSPRSATPT